MSSKQSFVEATAEAVAEKASDAGAKVGRMVGWSVVAVVAVHALTSYRHVTVCWLLNLIGRGLSEPGKEPGYFATLFLFAAQTYDATWTFLLSGTSYVPGAGS